MKPNLNKRLLSVPNPKLSLLIDMKLSSKEFTNEFIPEKIIPPSSSDNQKDEELEEELKDNIAYLDNNNFSIRKVYRLSAKNPYSLLQQPIIKRFSHNFTIRESLTPTRASVKGIKSDQNCLSDLGLKLSDNIFPLPKDHHSLEESLSRSKTKVFEKADRDENFSIYEGKTRNSIIANIDDFQRSFFLKNTRDEVRLQNFNPRKNESNDFNINGSILKNSNEGNETELEFANEERKMLYEYLVDFMVLNLDDQETDENNFLMDVETEKLQKELNDIPGFYKKLKLTVGMKECAFLQVVKMNELEKIKIDFELYPDSFPCLSVRKNLLLLKRGMSMICKFIVNSKVFEILTLLIIVFNSSSYSLRNNQSNHYDGYVYILQWAEDYFLFYYSAEMILKILAFGFFNDKDSYFRDGWNILDFSVIIGLYLSYTNVRDLNLSLLRLLRLLRPLKTSSAFKGLRIILYSLFSSLPFLFISFLVLNLFYSIFAIAGLQVFAGVLKQRCFNPITGISDRIDDVCGNIVCIKGYICGQMMNNPYNNIINFDNLYSSYLMTLLTVTLDNWTTIMYFVLKAYSNYVWVYHVSLAILGNYFLLNLLLAVIKAKFTESHQYLSEEIQEDKNHEKSQKYTDLYEIKKEGLWKGRQSLQKIKVERIRKNFKLKKYSHFIFFHLENFKGWLKCFVNMLKFYLFDNFLSKIRVTPKSQPKNKKSEDFQAKHNEFSLDLRSKKKSTLAILNKYTTKILSYFIINDKNIIQKKNSKIDKETNPKYLKLKVNNKKEYEDVNYQDVLEITLKKRIIAEQKNLDSIKKEQKLFFSLKKNKNNFLDILRDLNKKNQNAIRAYDHNSDTEKFLRPFLKKSTIRSFLKKNQMANEMTKIDKKQINSKDFVAIMKEKSNLALVPSSRVRNMVFNKLKILTKIDDHQAYVLTFKSSPSSFSRLSKSITQTHSILGKSGSKIFGSSINSLRISGLVSIFNRIKNRNFKPNEEEYIFIKAMINAEIDIDDLAEKEKFVEESMNFHQKYLKLMKSDKKDFGKICLTWSAQDILMSFNLDKLENILEDINLNKLEDYIEEIKFKYRRFRKKIDEFVRNSLSEKISLITIISYLILLANIGILSDETIDNFDIIYNIIFTIELFLKLFGFGIGNCFKDNVNIMDSFILLISYLALIIESLAGKNYSYFRFFYTLKVLRAFRIFKKIKYIQTLMDIFSKALSSFVYLLFLLILFNFVYSLIGMQLFGGKFDKIDSIYSKFNFDTFWVSFVTTFDIITLDNWIDIIILGFKSNAGMYVTGVFVISWIFLGNFVLLNLFLAILLDSVTENFTGQEIIPTDLENEEPSNQASLKFVVNKEAGDKIMDELSKLKGEKAREFARCVNIDKLKKKNGIDNNSPLSNQPKRRSSYRYKAFSAKSLDHFYCENSLFFFSKTSKIRIFSFRIISHINFERFMNFIIFASCLALIMETYLDFESDDPFEISLIDFCNITDIFLAVIYSIEILIKGITYGMFLDRKSYLRNAWNLLDFLLSICYVIDTFTPENSNSLIIKSIKMIKIFRPVKIIIINPNIRVAVNSLLISTYSIANVFFFILIIWFIFGILGTIMFRDRFGFCEDKLNFDVGRAECMSLNKKWIIFESNFDNILNTLLTLFIISTLDGWCDVMSIAINSNIDTNGPHKFNNEYTSYSYFLIFILIGTMFLTNLFISVIFMDFVKEQKKTKHKFLTNSQVAWINIQSLIIEAKPNFKFNRPPKNRVRKFFFNLFMNWITRLLSNIVIVLDIIILSSYYDSANKTYKYNLELIHMFLNLFFLIEFALKLLGYGYIGYFHDVWNKFEFFIIMTIIFDVLAFFLYKNLFIPIKFTIKIIQGMRALKILLLLKIFSKVKSVQKLLQTLKLSLPMVLNIFSLMMLIYYIYVIFGCNSFKHITTGKKIDDYINFQSFAYGLMTMFKVSTADDWGNIMYDIMVYHNWSWLYFVSFYIITTEIMINLFILVLLNQFDEYSSNSENPMHTFKDNLEGFRRVWSHFTVKHKGKKMHQKHILKFFSFLKPPLGYYGKDEKYEYIYKDIMQMNLKSDNSGFIYFNQILFGTMKRAYYNQINLFSNKISKKKIETIERKTLVKLNFLQKTDKGYQLKKTKPNFSEADETICIQFNPLKKHLYGKLCFLSWRNYSEILLEKILISQIENRIFFEDNSSEEEDELSPDNPMIISEISNFNGSPLKKHCVTRSITPVNL